MAGVALIVEASDLILRLSDLIIVQRLQLNESDIVYIFIVLRRLTV